MPSTGYKKLPRGFVYPVSRRMVRDIIAPYHGLFKSVEYDGVSFSEQRGQVKSNKFYLGMLKGNRVEGVWEFRLTLGGLRKESVGDDKQEIVGIFRDDITFWVKRHIGLPETTPDSAPYVWFTYTRDESTGRITSTSFAATIGNPLIRVFNEY